MRTQAEQEAAARLTTEYATAKHVIETITELEKEIAQLKRHPALKTIPGQLANLDNLKARIERLPSTIGQNK